ncbi:MAG: hypothetical protein ABI148_06035, partial [Ginsengibacter sp.]
MKFIKKYFGDLFLSHRFFVVLAASVALFIIAFYIPVLQQITKLIFIVCLLFCLIDYSILFFTNRTVLARRITGHRFSNGDENPVEIIIKNELHF